MQRKILAPLLAALLEATTAIDVEQIADCLPQYCLQGYQWNQRLCQCVRVVVPCPEEECPMPDTFWNQKTCECDCELKYPPRGCPEGSVLDEECCKCIVPPCVKKDCPGHYNVWNEDTCDCECLLNRDYVDCPAGSSFNEECCSCEVKACVREECDTSAFFAWNEETCACECNINCDNFGFYTAVVDGACKCESCEQPAPDCLLAGTSYAWDPLNCRCYCDTTDEDGQDLCKDGFWDFNTCTCNPSPCDLAVCEDFELPDPDNECECKFCGDKPDYIDCPNPINPDGLWFWNPEMCECSCRLDFDLRCKQPGTRPNFERCECEQCLGPLPGDECEASQYWDTQWCECRCLPSLYPADCDGPDEYVAPDCTCQVCTLDVGNCSFVQTAIDMSVCKEYWLQWP